jgi:hypothetical protein
MEATFILALIATALIAWACTDRVIYRGAALVTANIMKHASPTYKTVMVVPYKDLNLDSNILVAVVSNTKASEIAQSPFANRQVVVRRRLFGAPRVTRIS